MLKCSWSLRITTVQTMQNGQKNSAKLDFSKFCQTLANVQKRLPRSKFCAKLCAKLPENSAKLNFSKFCQTLANVQKRLPRSKFRAKLPEKLCKTRFSKILPNVSKCSKTHIYKQNYAENSFKCLYELINH